MDAQKTPRQAARWRLRLYDIIFEADTSAGKAFDIALIASIAASVGVVLLESVADIRTVHGLALIRLEWFFTVLFTAEYVLRLICVRHPLGYARSFFGVIDLLAVLPSYLDVLFPGSRFFLVIRILRMLRIFRVLKLVKFVGEADALMRAVRNSRRKILIFLFAVVNIAIIMGSAMYVIEGEAHGFTSIPRSIYWAIVTMTTVGYGDISPRTAIGQTFAAILMIIGYSVIAIPTGILSAEFAGASKRVLRTCPACMAEGHEPEARFCRDCGATMEA